MTRMRRFPRHERVCLGPLAPVAAFPARALELTALGPRALVCGDCGAVVVGTAAQLRQAAAAERLYQCRLGRGVDPKREASPRRTYAPRRAQGELFKAA